MFDAIRRRKLRKKTLAELEARARMIRARPPSPWVNSTDSMLGKGQRIPEPEVSKLLAEHLSNYVKPENKAALNEDDYARFGITPP